MTDKFQIGPRSKEKKEQNQVVNEEDQQEKVNPGEESLPSTRESEENSTNSYAKYNKSGLIESQQGLEEGNNYENDPKGENKMPM